jgi:hypothetical protein
LFMLPQEAVVIGLDEHTALIMDLVAGTCQVMGRGGVTLCWGDREQLYQEGQSFAITELGPFHVPDLRVGIPDEVWERARAAQAEAQVRAASGPPAAVLALVEEREAARAEGDWATADLLRERVSALGWEVRDTPNGPELAPALQWSAQS